MQKIVFIIFNFVPLQKIRALKAYLKTKIKLIF